MQWEDICIVLAVRILSENSRIVTVFSENFGKISGAVRGLKSSIQKGDVCNILWTGRTAEHLGSFKIECIFSPFIYVFKNVAGILAIESACTLCLNGMPEKSPHKQLFNSLKTLFMSVANNDMLIQYAIFEVSFLSEVGYGLDLTKCAVTEKKDNLFYVSPKTGKAVTKDVGEFYKDRLFLLPSFLINDGKNTETTDVDIFNALKLTGYFLEMYFYGINKKALPLLRGMLVNELNQ